MQQRVVAAPQSRLAMAAVLSVANSAAARLLPFWRGVRGLARGLEGWRTARAESHARKRTMERLVARLGWTTDDLPTPDGWAGSPDLLAALADHVFAHKPRTVVEFGSGLSTLVLARALALAGGGQLVSYDHLDGFAELTRRRLATLGLEAEVHVAPLSPAAPHGYPGEWYDAAGLPERIDLLLIDGPPDWLAGGGARGAAGPTLFHRLSPGGTVLLDDADRDGEREVAARWRREFLNIAFDELPAHKGLLRGVRAG
jgi:predicted O-methyltransferase YrrM